MRLRAAVRHGYLVSTVSVAATGPSVACHLCAAERVHTMDRGVGWTVRVGRGLVPGLTAVLAVATLLMVPRPSLTASTYAGTSTVAAVSDAAAGLGLVVAAVIIWVVRHDNSTSSVLGLAGLAWFAPAWTGWLGGSPVARSVAMIVEPFFLVAIVHVVLATPSGRLAPGLQRLLTAALYTVTVVVSLGRALFRDPFLDPGCWSNCRDNVFLVSAQPSLARLLDVAWLTTAVVAGLALVAVALLRSSAATPAGRRILWPVMGPGALLGASIATYATAIWLSPAERPHDPLFAALFHVRAWAAVLLAAGVVWVVIRAWRVRDSLARLAADLGAAPEPGSLGRSLARATVDPGLEVAYPLDGSDHYVDAAGHAIDLAATTQSGRVSTPIIREGRQIAVVVHERGIVDAAQLREQLGPAATLALDNERLHAEVLAKLKQLRQSRARVVAAGDAERRRLERNLHDGAQQRLLALTYDLRLAAAAANAAGDRGRAELLGSAEREALNAVGDLRTLAHGIYPAILTEAGIGPALWTLAETAPLPVEIEVAVEERYPEVIERTAYIVAADAIEIAADRTPEDHVAVRVAQVDGHLVVEVTGEGVRPGDQVADRVGAVGGRFVSEDGLVRAELPCV